MCESAGFEQVGRCGDESGVGDAFWFRDGAGTVDESGVEAADEAFAVWVKESHTAPGCFGDYVRELSKVQVTDRAKTGRIGFLGYGYLTWIGTLPTPNSFWAVGYGGQRIAWNPSNGRILLVFSNVENYMDEVAKLYGEWAKLP